MLPEPLSLARLDRFVVYCADPANPSFGTAAGGLVFGEDGGGFERAEREYFDVRPADGGGRLLQHEAPRLHLVALESAAQRALRQMADARARVRAILWGTAGAPVVWDEPVRLDTGSLVEHVVGSGLGARVGLRLDLVRPGPGAAVARDADLLLGLGDPSRHSGGLPPAAGGPGALGLAAGWSATAGAFTSLVGGAQTLAAPAGARVRAWVERLIPVPAGAERLPARLWADLAGVETDPMTQEQAWLFLEALSPSGAVVASTAEPVFADGPEDVALRLPPGTWAVRAGVEVLAPAAAPSGAVTVRSLRLSMADAGPGFSGDQTGLVLAATADPEVAVLFASDPATLQDLGDVVLVTAPAHAFGDEADGVLTIITDDTP